MKKTILCLLYSLLLLFPLLSLADTFPCPHYPGQYVYEDLLEVTRVDPDVGVDGWVELACPECGQVVETFTLLALVPEADHPAASDDEIVMDAAPAPQSVPEPVAEPDPVPDPVPEPDPVPDPVPDPPAQPEAPVKVETVAETAAQSEAPQKVEAAAQSEAPQKAEAAAESAAQPEAPAQPEAAPVRAAESEAPAKAEDTPETESSAGAEASAQSENPLPQADGTATAAAEAGGAAQQAVKADPPKAQDVTANVAPQQTGGTAGGGGSTGSAGRKSTNTARVNAVGGEDTSAEEKKNIRTFPYRRVKMKPRPGIRAEAAGILLWPAYGTPFQSLYND
jgi:hypothetical protein